MQNIIKKNKKYLIFIMFFLIISLICGFLYYQFLNDEMQIQISNTLNNYQNYRYNFIFKYLIAMSLSLVLSFFIIGIPCCVVFLFYECFSLGFLITIFSTTFGISGFVYSLLFVLINKMLAIMLMFLYLKKIINIGKYVIGYFIYKKEEKIFEKIIYNFKNSLYIILFVLLLNVILYFVSPYVFKYFSFLLK